MQKRIATLQNKARDATGVSGIVSGENRCITFLNGVILQNKCRIDCSLSYVFCVQILYHQKESAAMSKVGNADN